MSSIIIISCDANVIRASHPSTIELGYESDVHNTYWKYTIRRGTRPHRSFASFSKQIKLIMINRVEDYVTL